MMPNSVVATYREQTRRDQGQRAQLLDAHQRHHDRPLEAIVA